MVSRSLRHATMAMLFTLREEQRRRSRSENHWLARPVGTGSLGVGTKETVKVMKVEEGEESNRETEKDGRSGEGQRERNDAGLCLGFYEPVAYLNELSENSIMCQFFLFMGRLTRSRMRDSCSRIIVRQSFPYRVYDNGNLRDKD